VSIQIPNEPQLVLATLPIEFQVSLLRTLLTECVKKTLQLLNVQGVVALQNHVVEFSVEQLVHPEDGFLQDRQFFNLDVAEQLLPVFGPAAFEFLPLGTADVLQVGFVQLVFVLDVGVGCGVGEVAAAAAAGEVAALGVFPSSPCVLLLHYIVINGGSRSY
jgi:hypothetical protein